MLSLSKKMKDLPPYLVDHLKFIEIFKVKRSVVQLLFILDVLISIPLFYPVVPVFLYILVPFILVIHVWGLRLFMKSPYSTQFEFLLYLASYGLISGLAFFLIAQKMAYFFLGFQSVGYYMVTTIPYILIVCGLLYYQTWMFSRIRNKQTKSVLAYGGFIAVMPALGYILAQSTKHNEVLSNVLLVAAFYFFAIVWAYVAVKFFHKYFFMKANLDYVIFQKPSKNDYKKGEVKKNVSIR